MTEPSEAPTAHPTPLQGLGILVAVVVAIAILIAAGHVAGLDAEMFAGFLFLLYWLGFMKGAWSAFGPALAGALAGLAIGWCIHMLPLLLGPGAGTALMALIILGAMYLLIVDGAPYVVNYATMLLLTVAATPLMPDSASAGRAAGAVLIAALYAAALFALLGRLSRGGKT